MIRPLNTASFICGTPVRLDICRSQQSSHPRRRPRTYPQAVAYNAGEAQRTAATFTGTPEEGRSFARAMLNAVPDASQSKGTPEEDGRAIAGLYSALRDSGALQAFGAAQVAVGDLPIALDKLAREAGFPLSALSPKRSTVFAWQASGVLAVSAIVLVTRAFHVEQLARPLLLLGGAAFVADQALLRGATFEGLYRTLFPQYAEKVLRHEAGHFLAAYLLGLPVRGFVLSAADAARAGFPGQAGTLFFDGSLAEELRVGKLTRATIARHACVLMAGIAAEAIVFGEAEGGESDIQALLQLLTALQPPWTAESVRKQARWSVLQAVTLLRENTVAYNALCDAMREGQSLGDCVQCIERLAVIKRTRDAVV